LAVETKTCNTCPYATYQNESNSVHCTPCPTNSNTTEVATKSSDGCLSKFNLILFRWLMYLGVSIWNLLQSNLKATLCDLSNIEVKMYSRSISPFVSDYCAPGQNSSTGLAPCAPCPLGTYQTNGYSTSCDVCPDGKMTFIEGAVSDKYCKGKSFIEIYVKISMYKCISFVNDLTNFCYKT